MKALTVEERLLLCALCKSNYKGLLCNKSYGIGNIKECPTLKLKIREREERERKERREYEKEMEDADE